MTTLEMIGVVAEWHPFHNGHLELIQYIRNERPNAAICAVMSGPFTQRGEAAIFDKWMRAEMALAGGVNLILELPQCFAGASLAYFARGAVQSLCACGALNALAFGSESGNLSELRRMAAQLRRPSPAYQTALKAALANGQPYMIAHQRALCEATGAKNLERRPNDRLAVHYLAALPESFPALLLRRQSTHDGAAAGRAIRARIAADMDVTPHLPSSSSAIIQRALTGGWRLPQDERLLLPLRVALLGNDPTPVFRRLDPAQTGMLQRFRNAAKTARTLKDFVAGVQSRHYHEARVRRDILTLLSPLPEADFPAYLRVLGADEKGRALLKKMQQTATLPLIVNPGRDRRALGAAAEQAFQGDLQRQNLASFLQDVSPYDHMDRDYQVPPLMR